MNLESIGVKYLFYENAAKTVTDQDQWPQGILQNMPWSAEGIMLI